MIRNIFIPHYLYILILFFSCTSDQTSDTLFKSALLPNKIYTTHMESEVDLSMEFQDSFMRSTFHAAGMPGSIPFKMKFSTQTKLIAGDKYEDGTIPIQLTFEDVNTDLGMMFPGMNDDTNPSRQLEGVSVYARVGENSQIQIDSFTGNTDPTIDSIARKTLQNFFSPIDFPEKKLNPGDSFTAKKAVSMTGPFADDFDWGSENKYTLVSIENNIAHFNIEEENKPGEKHDNTNIEFTGSGKGKMEFDLSTNTVTIYEMDGDIDMKMSEEGMEMQAKGKVKMKKTVKVE